MYARLLKRPFELGQSFFLFGPRGTGKTTWLREHFGSRSNLFVDLLDGDLYTELLARPHRLETLIGTAHPDWVILDEIQRVPALLNEVHRLIEGRGLRFAMTGSSARSLRRKGVNLLAGRALSFQMHPLTASELGQDFDLERALRFGQLPSVIGHKAPSEFLASYVQTYLREEVQQEGLARNLANFARFLETASFSQGAPLNVAHVAREAALDRKVVENYFGILDDLLIGYRLPVFTKRAQRRMVAHPKFYFFDAGVYRTIRPMGPLDSPAEAEGAGLETILLQELRAVNDALGLDYEPFYWRTSDGTEVDFVLYGPRGMLAFEIKRSNRYTRSDLTGLRAFNKDYPMARCYLLYGGSTPREEEGVLVRPIDQALPGLASLLQGS
ncbi:MAG TPA: ATPase [Verrucomicrobia bacterium]|nr:MAG: ATPase [Lentisphaerae bacterium GWF2_57_35]HBA84477.1 ATPase [Verrucomicrobiota bacterium]